MYKTLHKKQGSVTVQLRFARSSVTFCAKRDNISALKTYKSICVKISATKDTTEGAVSGVGNESVTLYAK